MEPDGKAAEERYSSIRLQRKGQGVSVRGVVSFQVGSPEQPALLAYVIVYAYSGSRCEDAGCNSPTPTVAA